MWSRRRLTGAGWATPGSKRGSIEILYDVLTLAGRGRRKTPIMRGANLSHDLVVKYLDYCEARGLLSFDAGAGVYRVTARGEALRRRIDAVRELLEPLSSPG